MLWFPYSTKEAQHLPTQKFCQCLSKYLALSDHGRCKPNSKGGAEELLPPHGPVKYTGRVLAFLPAKLGGDKGFGVLQSMHVDSVIRKVLCLLFFSISDGQHVPACSVAGPQGIWCLLGNASAHVAQQKRTYAVAVCQGLRGASLDQLVLQPWLGCQIPRNQREKQWTGSNKAGRAKPQDSKQKLYSYLVYNLSCLFPRDIKGKKVVWR